MVKKDVENVDSTMNDIFVRFFLSKNYFDLTIQIFMIVSFCNITANKRRNFEVGKIELGVKEQSQ